jgi:hypothetical protein
MAVAARMDVAKHTDISSREKLLACVQQRTGGGGVQNCSQPYGGGPVGVIAAPLHTGKGGFYSNHTGATKSKAWAPGPWAACAVGAYRYMGGAPGCVFLGLTIFVIVVGDRAGPMLSLAGEEFR